MNESSVSLFDFLHINSLIFLGHLLNIFACINHGRLFKLILENGIDEIDMILLLCGKSWYIFIFFASIFEIFTVT